MGEEVPQVATIANAFTLNYGTIGRGLSLPLAKSVDSEIASHSADIGPRALFEEHLVAGPPYPLVYILRYIFGLGLLTYKTERHAVNTILNLRN